MLHCMYRDFIDLVFYWVQQFTKYYSTFYNQIYQTDSIPCKQYNATLPKVDNTPTISTGLHTSIRQLSKCQCSLHLRILKHSTLSTEYLPYFSANVLQIFPVFVPGIPRSCSTTFCWEKQTGRKEADFIKLLLVNFL